MSDDTLSTYILTPAAQPDDPRWGNSPSYGRVVVRARSTGDARLVASEAEPDFLNSQARPGHGVTTIHASAFRDKVLYHVTKDSDETHKGAPRGVVSSETSLRDANILKTSNP